MDCCVQSIRLYITLCGRKSTFEYPTIVTTNLWKCKVWHLSVIGLLSLSFDGTGNDKTKPKCLVCGSNIFKYNIVSKCKHNLSG